MTITEDPALTALTYQPWQQLPTAVRLIGTPDAPADAEHLGELYQLVREVYGGSVIPSEPSRVNRYSYWDKLDMDGVLRILRDYRISECGVSRPWKYTQNEGLWLAAAIATLIMLQSIPKD